MSAVPFTFWKCHIKFDILQTSASRTCKSYNQEKISIKILELLGWILTSLSLRIRSCSYVVSYPQLDPALVSEPERFSVPPVEEPESERFLKRLDRPSPVAQAGQLGQASSETQPSGSPSPTEGLGWEKKCERSLWAERPIRKKIKIKPGFKPGTADSNRAPMIPDSGRQQPEPAGFCASSGLVWNRRTGHLGSFRFWFHPTGAQFDLPVRIESRSGLPPARLEHETLSLSNICHTHLS